MHSASKAAVVITCYNYGDYIEDAVCSAIHQTYEPKEIILVDDGSNDPNTLTILKKITEKYPQVIVIYQTNGGPSAARNCGVRHTDASFILQLDGDDTIEPTYLQKAVALLQNDPTLSPVYADGRYFGEKTGEVVLKNWSKKEILRANFVWTAPVFSRKAWEDCKGYDEYLKGNEDYELYLHMAIKGYTGVRIPEFLINKRIHDTVNPSFNQTTSDLRRKNDKYLRNKHRYIWLYKLLWR